VKQEPEGQKSELEERVRALFRQGGYADAVPVIKEHLAAHRDDAPSYELLADALRFSGNKQGAAAALSTASDVYASKGMTIQSIAAQKRVIKLGVDPDFSAIRGLSQTSSHQRVPTPLFDELSDVEFEEVARRLESRSYEPGEVAVTEGAPGDSMFVIASGTMEVVVGKGESEMKLAELGSGDFFGESALLSGRARTATIRATTHVECLELSRMAWGETVTRHPRVLAVMEEFNKKRAASTVEAMLRRKH
jgi:cAMP-dependent protein kinase regulator